MKQLSFDAGAGVICIVVAGRNNFRRVVMSSLQDQLLKSGVIDKKKAKNIAQEKRKQKKQTPKGQTQVNEATEEAKIEEEVFEEVKEFYEELKIYIKDNFSIETEA